MITLQKDKYLSVNKRPDVVALRKYIIDSFKDLQFIESSHQYFLHGKELTSVSHVCHKFTVPFDKESKALGCYEKYFNNPIHKYYQMTVEQIIESWDKNNKEACDKGHTNHSFGENCAYLLMEEYDKIDRPLVNGNLIPQDREEEEVVRFYNDLPENYIPILTETRVYDEEKGYAGTFDNLFAVDKPGKKLSKSLIITDFKTNTNLFKSFNDEKMLPPFDFMLNTSYSSYVLQLSLYERCLTKIKLKVIGKRLIWLRTNAAIMTENGCDFTDKYQKYDIDGVVELLNKCL
jgi:hypothetical protein